MQNENGRLKIHTNARPVKEEPVAAKMEVADEQKKSRTRLFSGLKGGAKPKKTRRERRMREVRDGLTVGEKLLRNTAVACALLLSVMALKNVDQPWSRKVTEGVRQAMTMRIDWDETLGRLSFVRSLVPETALVFLNLGQQADLTTPVEGDISHEYTDQQPWIEYECAGAQQVLSATDGVVTAAGQGAGGDWIVLIQNADGLESVYGYLEGVYVQAGQEVKAGQQIGSTSEMAESRLYFELREDGEAVDPTGRMK